MITKHNPKILLFNIAWLSILFFWTLAEIASPPRGTVYAQSSGEEFHFSTKDATESVVVGEPQWLVWPEGTITHDDVMEPGVVRVVEFTTKSTQEAENPASPVSINISNVQLDHTVILDLDSNVTINLTGNQKKGQIIKFILKNDATLGRTITFGTNILAGALIGTVSKVATIMCISDGTNFYEVSRTLNL